ncbi:hypothetical protein LZC95_06690 [Pendulispora brunnea]|uniref:Tetratricopeptide repeat protein n=1 Tax=Pendulispora brunnea TaxID=2905690 RepID=A0ABZ2KCV8_9BACT
MTMHRFLVAVLLLLMGITGCASTGGAANRTANKPPEDRDPQLLFERGKAYADIGDLVRAEQYFGAALAAHADERRVLPELLRVCVASRHYRLASEYAQVALARRPKDAHLRFVAGALYVSIGEIGRAREHLEQAARDMPEDAEVQFAVGTFFRDELTDQIGADPYFREYLRLAPRGSHADEARTSLMQTVAMPAPEVAQ